MKKLFTILLIFILIFTLSSFAFASNKLESFGIEYDMPSTSYTDALGKEYPYFMTLYNGSKIMTYYFTEPALGALDTSNGQATLYFNSNSVATYWSGVDNAWLFADRSTSITVPSSYFLLWNFVIYDLDGNFIIGSNYFEGECDGSSCPATDTNHDNICDDCLRPLTMNLRTTLFDYAIIHAREGCEYYGYNYFAIFYPSNEAEWDNKYEVYLSNTPFVPTANGYVGEDIKTCFVQRTAAGENGATGWSSVISVPILELAYAEPEINFPIPPLEETVQEVTEGALMEEMITLAQAVKTILIIAVSCLALWALLEIFLKVFRTFRVR